MWWESLPSFSIIAGALVFPFMFAYWSNRLVLGTPYKRDFLYYDDAHHYLRDSRLSGNKNPYKQIGLNCFEAEEVEQPPKPAPKCTE